MRAALLALALLGQAHASCLPANLGGTGSEGREYVRDVLAQRARKAKGSK